MTDQKSSWLQIDRIRFSYSDRPIFDELSLTLHGTHAVLSVVGQSGIGKSTLIGLLAGFFPVQSGAIHVCGEHVTGMSAARPVVFQDHNLFPWKTVLGNVEFGLKCKGVAKAERLVQARKLLKTLHLDDVEHFHPSMLSGGMRQRVGLARALAVGPSCILMDEPFNALDHETKASVRNHFRHTIAESNLRAVLVTHDIQEAVLLGDLILVLRGPNDVVPCDILSSSNTQSMGEQDIRYWVREVESLLPVENRGRTDQQ